MSDSDSTLQNDLNVRVEGRAGRITLTRPQALNALSYEMCTAIDTILRLWREEEQVALVIIDAEGDKAFCAGGDIAELYQTGRDGNFDYGRNFWRDEYRMNALIADYPKPVISFMQGFTMGGGVGLGCHGSHRIVDDSSRMAMPECGIGLVPDVGGTMLLAKAPEQLGAYLGLTGARMGPADAILAGFADFYVPREHWDDLIWMLEASGDVSHVARHAKAPPEGRLAPIQPQIAHWFAGPNLMDIQAALQNDSSDLAAETLRALQRGSPLAMAAALEILARLRSGPDDIRTALKLEYRFTYRSMQQGDFLEGIRAQIIDKDRNPKWQYADGNVPDSALQAILAPLGEDGLTFEEETTE
mgnify:CR=1 FL=1